MMTEIKKEKNSLILFRLILTLSVCLLFFSPCMLYVQYIGGCPVHRGMFSISGGYHEYIGGYYEYVRGCSVHWVFNKKQKSFMNLLPTRIMIFPRCTKYTLYRVLILSSTQPCANSFQINFSEVNFIIH